MLWSELYVVMFMRYDCVEQESKFLLMDIWLEKTRGREGNGQRNEREVGGRLCLLLGCSVC